MAASLDATVGGASANSYVLLVEAIAYFEGRLNAGAWDAADADTLTRALIQAARRIDQEQFRGMSTAPLAGTSTGETQALQWPRVGACDTEGRTYLSHLVPRIVKEAQMELALEALNAGASDLLADTGLEGFESVKVGPLEIKPRHARRAGELSETVRRLLQPVLATTRHSARIVRS